MSSPFRHRGFRGFAGRPSTMTRALTILLLIPLLAASLALGACRSKVERAQDPTTSSAELAELAESGDPAVRLAVAGNASASEEALLSLATDGDAPVKLALLERPELPEEVFSRLRTDEDPAVRLTVARHPALPTTQALEVASSGDVHSKLALLDRPALDGEALDVLGRDPSPAVRAAVVGRSDVSIELLEQLALDPEPAVRAAVAAHPETPPPTLYRLIEGEEPEVRLAVAANPQIDPKTVSELSRDPDARARRRIAGNPATPLPVLNSLAREDESPEVREAARSQGSALPETEVDLVSAQRSGLVRVAGRGHGLQSLELELELEVVQPVRLTIEAGTVFRPSAAGTQTMVLTKSRTVKLEADRPELRLTLDAACAEMHADTPGSDDTFTLEAAPTGDLAKLLATPAFSDSGFRVRQFAVWTITDNPSRHGYVGLGSFGFGSGPSDEELEEIRNLFRQAGIPRGKYRAFG